MASELRRRKGRTILTALGLGIGVALVVTVSAMSDGLDTAQDKVLTPLTGVGTEMSVQRPLRVSGGDEKSGQGQGGGSGFGGLSEEEQDRLTQENKTANFDLTDLGEPGEKFQTTQFLATTQLSFPASEAKEISGLPGVETVAQGLTLSAANISGKVPKEEGRQQAGGSPFGGGGGAGGQGGAGAPRDINFDSNSVTGVDNQERSLGAVTSRQVTEGEYFSSGSAREALLNVAYARRKGIDVGDRITLKGRKFEVVGVASPPLGGQASDIYVKLAQLQRMSQRQGRVNTVYVRAASSDKVDAVSREIRRTFEGSQVTTSKELADRVGGSLVDAKNLSEQLGTALTVVGLVAAFLIASLLTLASVAKRVRELGTLKAIGWPQRLVVRQVTGEALAQGALGGLVGAALGIAGAAILTALGPELKATVAQPAQQAPPGLGQNTVNSGTQLIELDAPVDARLILVAVVLALVGGLLAGAVGGIRAARLTPADALRHLG